MKNFCFVTNVIKDEESGLAGSVAEYIRSRGGSVCLLRWDDAKTPEFSPEEIPTDAECILVFGGDGTMIRVATRVESLDLPIIGVNLGHLGYLCELEPANVISAVDRLMEDNCVMEERMMLSGGRSGEDKRYSALNDVVIHRSGDRSILHLNVYVNGAFLSTYLADGIIVATPTGSTGYNMSAGGPIVDPKARMLLLTPLNAHELNSRSIVLDAEDVVEIEIGSHRRERDELARVSFDGDTVMHLGVGERCAVTMSQNTTKVCRLNKESFLEIMRKKMEHDR